MGSMFDFDDLVRELDQFEQEAEALQERIARFMDDARQVSGNAASLAENAGGDGRSGDLQNSLGDSS